MDNQSNKPLLETVDLTKIYPSVTANDHVNFRIQPSSIHALLGENGAGKSTFVKMLYGLVTPSSGKMFFNGQIYTPTSPQKARAQGIGMVFQHFSLFDAMSVCENIAVGLKDGKADAQLSNKIREISKNYGLPIDPNLRVGDLSAGQKQRVEIVRCLLDNPELIIMDEPTSVLTPQEAQTLFQSLRHMRDEGRSILYISHKLDEIRELCDEATILRHGKNVGFCIPKDTSNQEFARLMVGQEISAVKRQPAQIGEVRLTVHNLNMPPSHDFGMAIKNLNLSVHSGEILGIAGIAGNGQDELFAALSGESKIDEGEIIFDNIPIAQQSIAQRRKLGILSAPEERLGHAAVPSMRLEENVVLTAQANKDIYKNQWINWGSAQLFAREIIQRFDVRAAGAEAAASSLSGGNLQKFVMGREIMQSPKLFICNQPSWGVDVAAAAFIRKEIRALADEGAAIIMISQDLDELFEISDSLSVLSMGQLSEILPASQLTKERIGQLMSGEFT